MPYFIIYYVTCNRLCNAYRSFLVFIINIVEHKHDPEAARHPYWRKATKKEIQTLEEKANMNY